MHENQCEFKEKLLIINNNVLSDTSNNGKTVLSYIDCLPKGNIAQLYFNGAKPSISGYNYFQISDKDILKGLLNPNMRGRAYSSTVSLTKSDVVSSRKIPRNIWTILIRELLWWKSWKSSNLLKWLDDFSPTSIFFVAGDSLFAYAICWYIAKKYGCAVSVYVTDDYIVERKNETFLEKLFRKKIKKEMLKILSISKNFFTISEIMREKYLEELNHDSHIIVNMTESLKSEEKYDNDESIIKLVYAGNLYYGRDLVISKLSDSIELYNNTHQKKCKLYIYSNKVLTDEEKAMMIKGEGTCFGGNLNKLELQIVLNQADFLVFVESFDEIYIEKTRYSLSTKVTEYLSLAKPIIAIGPKGIGSIEYLKDVSLHIDNLDEIYEKLLFLIESKSLQIELAKSAEEKYISKHNKSMLQEEFISLLFGD